MEFIEHKTGSGILVEVIADDVIISSEQEALDIMANIGYLYDSSIIVIHRENLNEAFFDLKSGLAGAILQKFSNYRVQLFVLGDFSSCTSTSLIEFIEESNRGTQINFLPELNAVMKVL